MATRYLAPLRDFMSLHEAMSHLLDDSFARPFAVTMHGLGHGVPVDIWQTEDELVVRASVPGVRPDDLHLSVLDGVLTLKGEQRPYEPKAGAHFLRQEIDWGAWERSFELPFAVQVDKAEAVFENGILTVTLPKAEEAKPRHIKISVNGGSIEGETV